MKLGIKIAIIIVAAVLVQVFGYFFSNFTNRTVKFWFIVMNLSRLAF